MKKLVFTFALIFASGCAVQPVKYESASLDKSSVVAVQDLRPAKEKEQEIFSYNIASEAYGIFRIKDAIINPDPVKILQDKVYGKFSNGNMPKEVKVIHFVSYSNMKSEMRNTAIAGGLFGGVGAAVAAGTKNNNVIPGVKSVKEDVFNSLEGEEYKRAFYLPEENQNKANVFIIYVDAEIDGKRQFIRKLSQITPVEGKNSYVAAVESTIEAWLAMY